MGLTAKNGHAKYTVTMTIKDNDDNDSSIYKTGIFCVVAINDPMAAELLLEAASDVTRNGLPIFLDHLERQRILDILDYN
jgi:hypothetical protein